MRFVQPKTKEQKEIPLLHRVRTRLVSQRTALSNQIRGLLAEYGVILPQGIRYLRSPLPGLLEDAENALSPLARETFAGLYEALIDIDQRVTQLTKQLTTVSRSHVRCQPFKRAPGIGPLVSTALFCAMGDPGHDKNGREFAAFLGLVPKQYSRGEKAVLKGISKRGDTHMRTLLIQGAQAVLSTMPHREAALSQWACRVKARRGHHIAVVALANKLARVCWAMASQNTVYEIHKHSA